MAKFKLGDKVKLSQAVKDHHVGQCGVVTEAPVYSKKDLAEHGQLYSVKLDDLEDQGGEKVCVTLGCVQEDHLEAVKEAKKETPAHRGHHKPELDE